MRIYHAIGEWVKEVTKRVWVARFRLDIPPTMKFLAGQYCSFHIKDNLRRTFSITTPPSHNVSFEICADVTPMGPGSVWLMNLKPGDRVEFLGPMGKFTLDPVSKRNRVFIATGTGIAPIRSMIYELLQERQAGPGEDSRQASDPSTALGTSKREVHLFWGLRYEEDVFWPDEFRDLEKNNNNFQFTVTLSQPSNGWTGKRGYVTEHLKDFKNIQDYDFYLCGNRGTIDSIKAYLTNRGVPNEQMKTELFF